MAFDLEGAPDQYGLARLFLGERTTYRSSAFFTPFIGGLVRFWKISKRNMSDVLGSQTAGHVLGACGIKLLAGAVRIFTVSFLRC